MKRIIMILAAVMCVAVASAQNPEKTLAEAQIEYDRAVNARKAAMAQARAEENRITDAAKDRVENAKREFEAVKESYK